MDEMKPIQMIPFDQIDLSDETFFVNFMPDLRSIRSSIQKVGLIQPVLLRRKEDGYQIVSGFRRIVILKELGIFEIPAMVFEEREPNDLELFVLSLQENLTTRGFNTVEKAIALQKLIHHFKFEPSEVVKSYLPLFSLEPNEKILNTYLSLAGMEEETKKYVLKGEVSRSNIRLLAKMSSEDRMTLIPFLSSLKLGENRLREILTLLNEISRRDRLKMGDLLRRPEIQTVLAQKELTPSQKTERVKKVLVDLRYPRILQLEKAFEEKRKKLNLPFGVSIHHPSYFEGKGLRVEFQFETMEKYQTILNFLSNLTDKKELRELLQSF